MNLASLLKILQTIQTVYPLVVETVQKLLDAMRGPNVVGAAPDSPADPAVVAACEALLAACKSKE